MKQRILIVLIVIVTMWLLDKFLGPVDAHPCRSATYASFCN